MVVVMVRHFMAPYKFELEQRYGYVDIVQCLVRLLQRGFVDQDNNTLLKVKEINIKNSIPQLDYTIRLHASTQNTNSPVASVQSVNIVANDNLTGSAVSPTSIVTALQNVTPHHLRVYGEIDYGKYNNKFDLIDSNSMTIDAIIPPTKSPTDTYFYMFYFTSQRAGFLILERIGNIGIRTSLQKAVKNSCGGRWIKIDPIVIGIREILEMPVKKIKILRPAPSREALLDELGVEDISEVQQEIVFSAKRNRHLIERLSDWLENNELSDLARIVENHYGENSIVSVEVSVGESIRTVYINSGKFRSWI
jgi:hypothetical protein